MKLSVIVPTLDGNVPESLVRAVHGRDDVEIVVVRGIKPVGKARNEGLRRAKGEYIAWVDADDNVSEMWLEEIMRSIESGVKSEEKWKDELVREIYRDSRGSYLWQFVTEREAWQGVEFDEKIIALEDFLVLPKALKKAKEIIDVKPHYMYTRAADSITSIKSEKRDAESVRVAIRRYEEAPQIYKNAALWGAALMAYWSLDKVNVGREEVGEEYGAVLEEGRKFLADHLGELWREGKCAANGATDRIHCQARFVTAALGWWGIQRWRYDQVVKNIEPNGMIVVDKRLREQGRIAADEVWVHGMWTPGKWLACIKAKLAGKKLVRMTHGSLSPIYLERQGKWKKRLVKPIEKLLFRMADKIVFTGVWEKEWFESWMKGQEAKFEIVDLKQFFDLEKREESASMHKPLHLLYLGREHPLKGIKYLELAVSDLNYYAMSRVPGCERGAVELKVVSHAFGEELESVWKWCDVLCLPTLSENFGLVVAEALERGKYVIVTDGAPAWESIAPEQGLYVKGYVAADEAGKIRLLKEALMNYCI